MNRLTEGGADGARSLLPAEVIFFVDIRTADTLWVLNELLQRHL